jgi:multidrug efflux pump subunit AcrA (membrane-fusion protein)
VITSTVTVNSTNKAAENKTVENQKTISQIAGDLSNINHQAESVNKGDVPNPENKSESKTSKNDKLRNALISGALIIGLLIPFPQTVGGEIEIEGSPGVQQAVLRASVNGIVEKVLVQTNQQIKAGQQIVALRNWDLDEKRLEAENHLAKLKGSIASQQAQSQVAKAEYLRAVQEYKRQKAESDYVEKNAKALKTDNLPPRIEATKKEVEQLTLQAKSLKQKAKLHQYLSQKGVYPSQGALQSAYEAVSAAKQAQSLNAQLKAEVSELEEKSIESQPKAEQVFIASQANLERLKVTQQEINSTAQEVKGIENFTSVPLTI